MVDVGLLGVGLPYLAVPLGQVELSLLQVPQVVRQVHLYASLAVSFTSASSPPTVSVGVEPPAPSATGTEAVVVGAGEASPSASATFDTLAAATLKIGCLETGSQSVMVSSLAARGWPFGPSPSGVSREPEWN